MMTSQNDFKAKVRQRMKKTGERYTVARFHLINSAKENRNVGDTTLGLLPGYRQFGGSLPDVAVIRNVLAYSGIINPLTNKPFSEKMLNGICGGLGFLYAVFEYKDTAPIVTLTVRSRSTPNAFIEQIFERIGVATNVHQTTSKSKARKSLECVLDDRRPAICTVDFASLPYYGMPPEMTGMSPHHVAVVGISGNDYLLDDRAILPTRIEQQLFANARSRSKSCKQRLVEISRRQVSLEKGNVELAIAAGIRDTVRAMLFGEVGVPVNFRANCGFTGMEKFARLLANPKDKKSWYRVFTDKERAFAGLSRLYDCVNHEYTSTAAGRQDYAEFLDEVEQTTSIRVGLAATLYRSTAKVWNQLTAVIEGCGDPSIKRAIEIIDQRAELLDQSGSKAASKMRSLYLEKETLANECKLTANEMVSICFSLAEIVGQIIEIEKDAINELATYAVGDSKNGAER